MNFLGTEPHSVPNHDAAYDVTADGRVSSVSPGAIHRDAVRFNPRAIAKSGTRRDCLMAQR